MARHICAAAQALSNFLCPVQSPVHLAIPLAFVDKIVAMAAQEVAPRPVEDDHPPTASSSGTKE